jgi:hypothetical protein
MSARRVTVAHPGYPGDGCRVFHYGNFETLLEEITQVRFDTHVRQHSAENDFVDAAFAQLENEVIGLRTKYSVRTDNDGFAVLDIRLKAVEPVGA